MVYQISCHPYIRQSVARTCRFMGGFTQTPLDETKTPSLPSELFTTWLNDAKSAELPLPMVASLATSSSSGRVSNRLVNVRGINGRGNFVIYSDWEQSRKGRDVAQNKHVALTFYWRELDRSARIEGTFARLDQEDAEAQFRKRPRDYQVSVAIGPQSQPVENRAALEAKAHALIESDSQIEVPDRWGGAEVIPDWYEFWQGRSDRISDRVEYNLNEGVWSKTRLTP